MNKTDAKWLLVSLMSAGHDCDILIHEATMEDDLVDNAFEKKHRFDIFLFCIVFVKHRLTALFCSKHDICTVTGEIVSLIGITRLHNWIG